MAAQTFVDAHDCDTHSAAVTIFSRLVSPVLLRMVVRGEDPRETFREMLASEHATALAWFEAAVTSDLRNGFLRLLEQQPPEAGLAGLDSLVRSDVVADRK